MIAYEQTVVVSRPVFWSHNDVAAVADSFALTHCNPAASHVGGGTVKYNYHRSHS